MRLFCLPLLALAILAGAFSPAAAQQPWTTMSASSGNVAAATATATLPAAAGKTTSICGFVITSTGSTATSIVSVTVTGVVGGTMTFTYVSVAGVTTGNQNLVVPFTQACVPATASNTTIVVSMPSLGAGNTNATVVAWGYQY